MTPPAYRSGIFVRQQPRDPFVRAVPMVRIRSPPAVSRLRTGTGLDDQYRQPRSWRHHGHGRGDAANEPRRPRPAPRRARGDGTAAALYRLVRGRPDQRLALRNQVGVWLRQGALSRAKEEHPSPAGDLRARQFVHGICCTLRRDPGRVTTKQPAMIVGDSPFTTAMPDETLRFSWFSAPETPPRYEPR